MNRKIFVNLPVRDLPRSQEFFSKLGFNFDARFTDDKAACLVIGPDNYVMLLTEDFFRSFIKKELSDTTQSAEVIISLSTESREELDELMEKALAAGAKETRAPQEESFMYGRSFEDRDGHLWEVIYMDMKKAAEATQGMSE